ncbi:hypothetical protein REC12_25815 [Desulfosporosinus sp. PR]|uniref:hypothetical protein n=1 Tax=Candidatus Desulfosporosinus nitrosoreducens TaxID=3401928 RepID=UPI0027E984A6|nr:hypothetical protein [Desulfosporosinus sp. PR]MDQ7097016.1 hypothetical protein [Desulfosporosinus sp. PR]
MSFKKYLEGDENKTDKNTLKAFRNTFIIQKPEEELGSDINATLKRLRLKVKIKYHD